MKIVKRTKKYFYVELGDNDLEDVDVVNFADSCTADTVNNEYLE